MSSQPIRIQQLHNQHVKDPLIAEQAKVLGSYGLSMGAVMIALQIRSRVFDKYYREDYEAGVVKMQRRVAVLAMEAAEAGSVPMIMYLCKSKLGWNETSVVEHVGEVRAVVSNKPMSRDEFEKRYLSGSRNNGSEVTVESVMAEGVEVELSDRDVCEAERSDSESAEQSEAMSAEQGEGD